jgi:hypothetical protein
LSLGFPSEDYYQEHLSILSFDDFSLLFIEYWITEEDFVTVQAKDILEENEKSKLEPGSDALTEMAENTTKLHNQCS